MTADSRAVLLDRNEVARRLGWSPAKVDKARRAVDPKSWPKPMPGWVQTGPDSHPGYRLPESALAEYIASLPRA